MTAAQILACSQAVLVLVQLLKGILTERLTGTTYTIPRWFPPVLALTLAEVIALGGWWLGFLPGVGGHAAFLSGWAVALGAMGTYAPLRAVVKGKR